MHVLIVDDHPLYRCGVLALLSGLAPELVSAEASSVAEALEIAAASAPFDLVLLDMNLPGINRLDALHAVKSCCESAAVVVISAEEDAALILQTIDAGAAGYVPKTTDTNITVQALGLVLAHGVYLPPHVVQHCAVTQRGSSDGPPTELQFTERQKGVLLGLLQGKPNKVIARELGIAEGTVKTHLWSVYQLLGVTSRVQAMCRVHALGLLKQFE